MFALTQLTALLVALLAAPGAAADVPRCDALKAEADALAPVTPVACDEARDTHTAYVKAIPELLETCRKLQTQVSAGEPKLEPGSEDQIQIQVIESKQRHLVERRELSAHVLHELLPTPLDIGDPTRLPPQVSSECGSEIETHVRFRGQALDAFTDLYSKLDALDDDLMRQAAERALPASVSAPVKNVR